MYFLGVSREQDFVLQLYQNVIQTVVNFAKGVYRSLNQRVLILRLWLRSTWMLSPPTLPPPHENHASSFLTLCSISSIPYLNVR